jgi:hypothetical protein
VANDTTTTVGASGGDLLDETQTTNLSGQVVKRPRVVIGDNDGSLVGLNSIDTTLKAILTECQRQTVLLRVLVAQTTPQSLDNDEIDGMVNQVT